MHNKIKVGEHAAIVIKNGWATVDVVKAISNFGITLHDRSIPHNQIEDVVPYSSLLKSFDNWTTIKRMS